ncbi:MAG: glycoside hydrolase family 38 C-terminal domain-containing protein, partial [Bacteroidota bacterium]
DGSRIRCIFPQVYVARTYPEEIRRFYDRYPSKEVSTSFLFLYGYGDGGGGPVREDVELGRRLADAPGFPRCRLSRVDEAIEAIRADADATAERYGQPLPVWKGELYLEFHRGTLTTHAEVKRRNRHGELLLRAAEIRSSLACLMGKSAYPAPELKAAWKSLLLNQFHDILPGTSIPEAYPEVHATYTEIEQLGGALLDAACEAVTEADEGAITVFNEHGWDVVDYVEAEVPAHSRPFRLVNSDGEEVAYQFVADQPGVIGFEAAVPALGTATYRLEPGEPVDIEPLSASEEMIETGRYRIEINAAGELVSVYDLDLEREWLRAPANVLQTFEDRPNNWEAWDVNDWYETKPLELLSCVSRSVVEQGPVRVVVRLRFETPAGSTLQQDIVVYRSVPRIDFPMVLDWHEQRVLLKAAYPVDVHAPSATYEIQFGAIERPTSRNTSWEQAKFEVCGHKWIDLSEAGGGVSLLNTGKYGHDVRDHVLRTTLLRTPTHPDPRAPHPPFMFLDDPNVFTDQGEHRTTLALYPHAGRWSEADTVRQAFQLNAPLRAVVGQSGTEQVAVSVEPAGAILESLKQAEDGDG